MEYVDVFVLEHLLNVVKGLGASRISIDKITLVFGNYDLKVMVVADGGLDRLIRLINGEENIATKKFALPSGTVSVEIAPVELTIRRGQPLLELWVSVRWGR